MIQAARMAMGMAGLMVMGVSPVFAETTSLANLMTLGQSVTCTYEKPDQSEGGTIYLAQNKMSGDIRTGGQTMHLLRDGEWQYVWGGEFGEGVGMKMPVSMAAQARSRGNSGPDFDEPMDYQCRPWGADASRFQVPEGVQFQDMSAMMGSGMMQAALMGGGSSMQCAACDQAPPDAQAECRQALGC